MRLRVFVVVACLGVLSASPASAQRLLFPEDLEASGRLKKIEELGKRGQWDKVVLGLDRLLAEGGDKLVKTESGFQSLKAEARRRLLTLTGRARDAYLLAHEEEAKTLLRIGRRSAPPGAFERILDEHPATPQAVTARRLLANRYLELGAFNAALAHVDELLRDPRGISHQPEALRLRALALAFLGRAGAAKTALEAIPDAERAPVAARVQAILGRELTADASAPADPSALAWTRPVFGFYETEAEGSAPWSEPASDGHTLFVHDGSHALAIELATGLVLWRTSIRDTDAFQRPTGRCTIALGANVVVCLGAERIVALDQASGGVVWNLPLSQLQAQAKIDFECLLATDGPPAVVGSRLAVPLVTQHRDREVHLILIDLATGNVREQVFVAAETGGKVPRAAAIAEGDRCFVVTGHGAVAAVSGAGELLWLKTYPSRRDERRRPGPNNPFGFGRPRAGNQETASFPSSLAFVGGFLWIAPSDGRGFTALDPVDGTVRGTHTATKARILGGRGLQVVGLDSPSKDARLCVFTRGEILYPAQLEGPAETLPVAWAGDRVYALQGRVLKVLGFKKEPAIEHSLPRPRGNLCVAGGRVVVAAPGELHAYGEAPAPPTQVERASEAVLAALEHENYTVRELASKLLLEKDCPVSRDQLAGAIAAGRGERSLRAAIALGELERIERLERWKPLTKAEWQVEIPDLLNRLTHPNAEVRLTALGQLGKLKDPDVNALLAELCERDRDARVAFTAAGALLEKGDRRGLNLVARALKGELPVADRLKAADLLMAHGTVADADLALPAVEDANETVRARALQAALKLSEGLLLERLQFMSKDPSPVVRLALIEAVAELVDKSDLARRIVESAIEDKNDMIRLAVVKRLAKVGTIDACRVLCRALGDPTRETAKLAAATINRELQRTKIDERNLTQQEQEARILAIVDPRGLVKGALLKDDYNRNYVAQLALRYVDAGGRLPIETLCRFMSDRVKKIRTYKIAGKPWAQFMLDWVDQSALGRADVAAIGSLTLEDNANTRIQAYQFLSSAASGPGRGAVLAQGLADENEKIRREVAAWLIPGGNAKSLIDVEAAKVILGIATGAERQEGREAAKALLGSANKDALAVPLIELAGDVKLPGLDWVLAVETLSSLSGGEVAYDRGATRAVLQQRFQRWWFKVLNGEDGGDALTAELRDTNPSKRFMAARKAAKMPSPSMRRALIKSLEDESTIWVLKEKLKALVKITSKDFGVQGAKTLPELKACAQRFLEWERAGAPEGPK